MPDTETQLRAMYQRINSWPVIGDLERARSAVDDLIRSAVSGDGGTDALPALLGEMSVFNLVGGIYCGSPYLSALIDRDPARLVRILQAAPEAHLATLIDTLSDTLAAAAAMPQAMRALRQFKNEVALLIALADLGGLWPVTTVTESLTQAADAAVVGAVRFLFRMARQKGDWTAGDASAADISSGYMVIAMGKYGAGELNYSSDIDLIVFFEPRLARVKPGIEPLQFFVRLTRDLVKMLQERTGDGYVFRTDLRLRPDPGATHVAMATGAALQYYESFGQNWERAALIKARAVAGDIDFGRSFLGELSPFIWRKYLDFAAISDIHAMKRQIHAFKGFGEIGVAGHNIKLGRGGIREIEFFVQTQQLIVGGRRPALRTPRTLDALVMLVERGLIEAEVARELEEAYMFLRRLEHRLQMVHDEQTQTLPDDPDKLASLARFCGWRDTAELAAELTARLKRVQQHYGALFESTPELTRPGTNMVFAGEADDPATITALAAMGFSDPSQVIASVRGWHHGRYRAVRSARARERLTEVQPLLIEALARTGNPSLAFLTFDRLLSELPSGVQLFALLKANPRLLNLVADIAGSAPRLARILALHGRVLDAVLDPGFFGTLPTPEHLVSIVAKEVESARDYQEALDRARVVGNEQSFLIGVRLLSGTITAGQAAGAYSLLAEHLVAALLGKVEAELARAHGVIPHGSAVVTAMGKLGGMEMTAASDLDLILVYDFPADILQSDGERPLAVSQYYGRLTQRLIAAISAQTAEGTLYEVDMRLRPSGQKGPVATQLSSFLDYQSREAWTWEHLALTRARVIAGPDKLREAVQAAIRDVLVRPRDRTKIAADVRQMRELIAKEKGTHDIWDLKQVRGGLVDLEFIAQFLQLVHAFEAPDVLHQTTITALRRLAELGFLSPTHADLLIPAAEFVNNLTQILRLCLDGPFKPEQAPDGLRYVLARAGECPDMATLEATLRQRLAEVAAAFDDIVR